MRAHAELVRELDAELRAAHGLQLSWYLVLCELGSAPEARIRMGELAERALLTRPGLTGVVDRLERQGLVERRPCGGDARGTYAAITQRGLHAFERAQVTHEQVVRRRYTGRLDDGELGLIAAVWERLSAGAV